MTSYTGQFELKFPPKMAKVPDWGDHVSSNSNRAITFVLD